MTDRTTSRRRVPRWPGASRRRAGGRSAEWPLLLVLLVLLLTGFSGLTPLLRGSTWWWVIAIMAVTTLSALAALRVVGVPRVIVPLAGLGVIGVVLTLFFGAGTGILWMIPTPATVEIMRGLTEQGVSSINEQSTPAVLTAGIAFLLAAGAGLVSWLVHLIAVTLRVPALAGLVVLIPALIPGLLLTDGLRAVPLLAAAAGYLWLLRADVRLRQGRSAREDDASPRSSPGRPARNATPGRTASATWAPGAWGGPGSGGGSLLLGGLTLVGALTLSLVVPISATTAAGGASGMLFGTGVSPMIDLGQDLRRPAAGPALHYVTTAKNRHYLTLLTLNRFEGTTWTADERTVNQANTVDSIDRPSGLGADVATVAFSSSIVIDGVRSSLLPLQMPATRINGLTGDWFWNSETLNVKGENASTQDQTYTVSSFEVAPTAEQLRNSSRDYPEDAAASLTLPEERPAIIDETAAAVTVGSATAYDSAVALQDYLNGPTFRYDTKAPVEEGYDGGGLDVVGTFLEVKSGYCVHFSSAMAVMARSLGIPARISIGYLPGNRTFNRGIETFKVDSHDLHAWPELYFVGVGWVPFEPTPGRGRVPEYAQASANPVPTRTEAAAGATQSPRPEPSAPAPPGTAPGQTAAVWPGTLVLLFALLTLIPALLRGWRRRGRLRRIRSGSKSAARDEAAEAWAEVTDTALDLGIRVSPTDTPREVAARLAHALAGRWVATATADRDAAAPNGSAFNAADSAARDAAGESLDRVLGQIERLRFSQPGPTLSRSRSPGESRALADDVDRLVEALFAAAPRRTRLRATLAPASLRPVSASRPQFDRARPDLGGRVD